jgi:ABC-type lipoprotein release transport system permease subunit
MFRVITRMAAASLVRRGLRSLLVVLMIGISLWGLLFMEGIYEGMTEQMINNAIRSDSGHLSIFASGYRLDPDLSRLVTGTELKQLTTLLAADERVRSTVQRIRQDGLVATAHYSRMAAIVGIDPVQEKQQGRMAAYLQQGAFDFGKKGQGVMIGYKLADRLQTRIGSRLILSAQDSRAEVSAAPFRVTGILKTNNMALDEQAVFISHARARKLLSLPDGVSQIAVMLGDEHQAAGLQEELRSRFPGLELLRWDELYPALLQSRVMMQGFNTVISGLIFCVAALGIFGVILVSVLERLREFGIMLAIGTRFSMIRNIVLVESFLLGFTGFVLGSLLGGTTLLYFQTRGLDLSMFSNAFAEFGMDAVTYAVIRPGYFVTAFNAVLFATLFSVLIPLRVLKKAKPIEAINRI